MRKMLEGTFKTQVRTQVVTLMTLMTQVVGRKTDVKRIDHALPTATFHAIKAT